MSRYIKSLISKIPLFGNIYQTVTEYNKNSCYPPGHFYSPLVAIDDIRLRKDSIWPEILNKQIPGINLNTDSQLKLVSKLSDHYKTMPFSDQKNSEYRYYFENDYYSYTDGINLYTMLKHFQPNKVIEIGSGFSSALMLDVNQECRDINLTFIEPYPARLYSLMSADDKDSAEIITKPIQSIDLDIFGKLNANDILFIDSSHIVKTGSDVNFILFEILPILKPGVIIHFHDIFYPFEYPQKWVFKGRNWNENYFLKSFLMYNNKFEILLFADYLHKFHKDCFSNMPLSYKNTGGNLWLRVLSS